MTRPIIMQSSTARDERIMMAEQEAAHLGKDGIDLRGNGSLLAAALLVFMVAMGWMFSRHLEHDATRNTLIEERNAIMEKQLTSLQTDHLTMTGAVNGLVDVLKEQNCILLADEQETKRIRRAAPWSNTACRKIMEAPR